MGRISRILTGFFAEDDGKSGLYEKADGTVWYRKPDGSEAEVGNGGSQPAFATERAVYFTNNVAVTVAGGAYVNLPFVKKSGASLLDLTNPQNPTFVEAGVHAVTFWVFGFGVASQADCQLLIDLSFAPGIEAISQAPMGLTNPQGLDCSVSLVQYVAAGDPLAGSVNHNDPAGQDLYHQTTIQRLST